MGLDSFETDILISILKSKKTLAKVKGRLKEKHFRNEILRWTYKVITDYHKKYGKLPVLSVFKSEIMSNISDSTEKKIYYTTIKKLFKKKKAPHPSEYVQEKVDSKINREELLTAIDKSVRNIEKGNLSAAKKELMSEILRGDGDRIPVVNVLKDWQVRQLLRKEISKIPFNERFIPTPYSLINKTTFGIQITEAGTIAGLTGLGKSMMLGEFGVNAVLDSLNVVHFVLENTADQTAQRYDSRLTGIKYDTIKLYNFSSKEMKGFNEIFDILSGSLDNDIKIVETFRKSADIVFVDSTIQSFYEEGFKTNLILIDSCDIMSPSRKYDAYRLERASIYWDFKDYCKLRRIPGITTTQLAKGSKGRFATSEDLAEAYDKARILDIVYIMSQTEEYAKRGIVQFSVDKNRDGISGIKMKLFKDAEKMRFLEVI